MKIETPPSEPSMDEILASIRQIISSNVSKEVNISSTIRNEEDVLDLTDVLPEEEPSFSSFLKKQDPLILAEDQKKNQQSLSTKEIEPPLENKKNEEAPREFDKNTLKHDDPLVSQSTLQETARAFSSLHKITQERTKSSDFFLNDRVTGQTIEGLVRDMLKPLLKEWLDTNLPLIVRWVVSEQVEKILHQGYEGPCHTDTKKPLF